MLVLDFELIKISQKMPKILRGVSNLKGKTETKFGIKINIEKL
jgi:hypothetical protein